MNGHHILLVSKYALCFQTAELLLFVGEDKAHKILRFVGRYAVWRLPTNSIHHKKNTLPEINPSIYQGALPAILRFKPPGKALQLYESLYIIKQTSNYKR